VRGRGAPAAVKRKAAAREAHGAAAPNPGDSMCTGEVLGKVPPVEVRGAAAISCEPGRVTLHPCAPPGPRFG